MGNLLNGLNTGSWLTLLAGVVLAILLILFGYWLSGLRSCRRASRQAGLAAPDQASPPSESPGAQLLRGDSLYQALLPNFPTEPCSCSITTCATA